MSDTERGRHEAAAAEKRSGELAAMKRRIDAALSDRETRDIVAHDFSHTFEQLGLPEDVAQQLADEVIAALVQARPLDEIEKKILRQFESIRIGEQSIIGVLREKLKNRAETIFEQIGPHLRGLQGTVLDYGAGDGQVAQLLHERLDLDVEGVDVRHYPAKGVTIPIRVFDGYRLGVSAGAYEAAVLTNVLHHDADNERIIQELSQAVRRRLVVLETVPIGSTEGEVRKDRERTFLNDFLYNRLFHSADVPVPGTFETPQGWVDRFAKYGWRVVHSENLGVDQPTIRDTHHLLVFER